MKKRFLAILLTICMVLSMAPAALAAETDPFTDVNSADWYYDEVQYVYENDLMKGTSDTTFSPDTTVSRAMIVTILYRLEGQPTVSTAGTFTDVAAGQYYTEAVEWGYANQIIGGYGSGLFGPSDPLTREQMAAILYRYAQYKEYDVSDSADLSGYTDVGTVSAYALDAFAWANANGLVKGTSATTLSPKGSATRAQFAVILCRFCVNVVADVADADTTEEYTVTFEYNYGSKGTYKTVTVEDGETVDKPANPTRGGYSFSGWYTKATGGEKFDFDTEIIKDTTLYAQWTKTSSNSGGGGSSHSHRYSNEWSYNAETHWHDATCGHNVKSGEAVHSPDKTGLCICGCYVAPENATQVTSFEELKAALANGGAIQVMNDIAISETLNAGAETTIYGYGNTLTYADGFVGTMLNASAKTTIYNLNMDGGWKTSENEFYAVYTSANTTLCGLTIENFVATKIVKTEHNTPGLTLTDVDVKNNTLVGRESGDQRACVFWLQGTSPVVFTNVTITGNTVPADYNNAGSGVILYFRNMGTNFDGTNVVIENNTVGNHIVASYSSLATNTYKFNSGSIKDNVGGNIFVVGKLTFGDDMYVGSNITITNDSDSGVSVLTNNGYIKGNISSNSQAWGRGETIYTGTGTVEGEIENLISYGYDADKKTYSVSNDASLDYVIGNMDATSITLAAGTYTMPSTSKGVTITGTKAAKVELPFGTLFGNENTITFDGVTIMGETNDDSWYSTLFNGAEKVIYKDCDIYNQLTTYCDSEFTDCKFYNTFEDDYSVYCYSGSSIKFDGCSFDSKCSKAIKVYDEGNGGRNVYVNNCSFTTETANEKAAVEIDSRFSTYYIYFTGKNTLSDEYTKLWNSDPDEDQGTNVYVDGILQKAANDQDALNNAVSGSDTEVEVNLAAGDYTMPNTSGDVTISGTKDTVISGNTCTAYNVTFNGVTIESTGDAYTGIQHSNEVVYNNVTIIGNMYLYAKKVVFNNCTFDLSSTDDYIWVYGATNVEFNNCTFNTKGKAILVFQDGSEVDQTVKVEGCTFNASQSASTWNKIHISAVSIDGSQGGTYNVILNKNTVDADFNGLWQDKTNAGNITVTVDGTTALTPNT